MTHSPKRLTLPAPKKKELFLVKLALLNANALADANLFVQHLQAALQDL